MSRQARIVGTGLFTCAGQSTEATWNAVKNSESGIREGIGSIDLIRGGELRAMQIATPAINEALKMSGWDSTDDIGFVLSTTTGFVQEWEDAVVDYKRDPETKDVFLEKFKWEALQMLWQEIKRSFGFKGDAMIVSTACAAGGQAVGLAQSMIATGKYKKVLVIGVETLSHLTEWGFHSFQLTHNSTCKPFDKNRNGINLSEASAAIALEASEDKRFNIVAGGGYGSDAFAMTSPHPEGRGLESAIRAAMKSANVEFDQVDAIHAHGTGSQHNDQAEAYLFDKLGLSGAPICSTKAIHGHSLASSGVLESVLADRILGEGFFPATYNCENSEFQNLRVSNLPIEYLNPKILLKTTLGFGGANSALVFLRGDQR